MFSKTPSPNQNKKSLIEKEWAEQDNVIKDEEKMRIKRAVIIPSDPLYCYINKGMSPQKLREYYNPGNLYKRIFILSSFEDKGIRKKYGMIVIGAKPYQFKQIIKRIMPNVVRAYDGFRAADYACANRVKGIPIIVSVHDADPKLIHKSLKYADAVFCMSDVVAKRVKEVIYNIDINRIYILPNRVDTTKFKKSNNNITQLNNMYPYKYRILHVGRRVVEKNLDNVIKALSLLSDEYCLVAIGQGDKTYYSNLAKEHKVTERYFMVDSVNNDELFNWYSWCSCICNPSRSEGFGIIFIEAAACKSIIVTSNIAPMNNFLQHEKTAYLVNNYESPREIAKYIEEACKNSENNFKMSDNVLSVAENFSKVKIDALEKELTLSVVGKKSVEFFIIGLKINLVLMFTINQVKR
ncbi:MAG TPA: glycosyltransferase family 4 protein, partial [Sedimentibacter sp.]|nr:glycosyltransferase family 4 protein [Sedimentibacter sp.]